jgi:hypothetical protein
MILENTEYFSTGDISKRLGFPITAGDIETVLGVPPARKNKAARLWTQAQVLAIFATVRDRAAAALAAQQDDEL